MERVVVIGSSCSGKTTFAQALAARLHAAHIELDALNFKQNWEARPPDELRTLVCEAVSQDRWVVDGNYVRLREVVWPRATTVIWLNYSFPLVWKRALRRTFRRVFKKVPLYSGNVETFRQAFLSRDSILLWVATRYWWRRSMYRLIFDEAQFPALEKIEFREPKHAEAFLEQVPT